MAGNIFCKQKVANFGKMSEIEEKNKWNAVIAENVLKVRSRI